MRFLAAIAVLCTVAACGGRTVEEWITASQHEESYERLMAVHALGRSAVAVHDPLRAYEALRIACEDGDVRVREQAVWSMRFLLFELHDELMPVICESGNEWAARVLHEQGAVVLPALGRALADRGCAKRDTISRLMAAIGVEALPHLVANLDLDDPEGCEAALLGIEILGSRAANDTGVVSTLQALQGRADAELGARITRTLTALGGG